MPRWASIPAFRSGRRTTSRPHSPRCGAIPTPFPRRGVPEAAAGSRPRTIVFHGGADRIVNSLNAERIFAAASSGVGFGFARKERGRSSGGRDYTRRVLVDATGRPQVEYWLMDEAGHAWAGGRTGGSYTDPAGPDASTEMVRFFLSS